MGELRDWQDLDAGAVVVRDPAGRQRTGSWRTGVKPVLDLDRCVDCLLCWLYCPDSAVVVENGALRELDYDVCKGCEICAAVCPVGAIAIVEEAPDAA
jgi:2-oxoacid:acceptor oxidoreductase delta subunit (pyruvate/2-ketoisovalerate family)